MATVNTLGVSPVPVLVDQQTAFGEVEVAQKVGMIYGKFTYNLNTELFKDNSTGSGSVTVTPPFSITSSGAATSSKGILNSVNVLEYFPGTGGATYFTAIFDTPKTGNNQLVGIGDLVNGFFIGYNNETFSILRRSAGVDTFVGQSSFNVDTLDGNGESGMTIDTTKGNVFKIQYQWLGFGQIDFFVENPETGLLIIFHQIKYTNANTDVSIQQPSLPFQVESSNTTNATDVVIKVPSLSAYTQGITSNAAFLTHGSSNSVTAVSAERAILTIRNNATFASVTNYIRISPKIVSITSDGTKSSTFAIYRNATLGGTPNFVDFNSNSSVVAIDKAGTTVTGGTLIATFDIGKVSNEIINLDFSSIILHPGDTMTISVASSSNTDATASITWQERFN